MQVKDEGLWQELVKELRESDHGIAFYDFVIGWVDRAEQIVLQDGDDADPADALRLSLADVEESIERKNIWIVGQALVVIVMHWVYGDEASEGLTEVEIRLVQDVTAAKIAQLQAQAEAAGSAE